MTKYKCLTEKQIVFIIIILQFMLPLICKELNGTRHTHSHHYAHLIWKLWAEYVQTPLGLNPPPADFEVPLHSLSCCSTCLEAVDMETS